MSQRTAATATSICPNRHGQPEYDAGLPPQIRGHRQVTQVGIEGGAMAHGSAGGAGQRLANFGPPGVVIHGGGIVLGIGQAPRRRGR